MARSFDWHCRVHRKRRGEMDRGYKKEGEGGAITGADRRS